MRQPNFRLLILVLARVLSGARTFNGYNDAVQFNYLVTGWTHFTAPKAFPFGPGLRHGRW